MTSILFSLRASQYCMILCMLVLCLPVSLLSQPVISTYSPVSNTIATISSNIVLNWSTAMNTSSVTGANIKVFGSMTGIYSNTATYSYSNGNATVTITPTLNFQPNEQIGVIVTTGARSSTNVNLANARVWNFLAASKPASGTFKNPTTTVLDQQPFGVALGDLNHDGKLDLVTSNPGARNASVRLGNGTGGFSGSTSVSLGNSPFGLALGDVNGDGHLDICAPNYVSNTVSIRRGNGNGTFTGTTNISVGRGPWSIALGDVNGDGRLDFATANFDAGTVSIRLGDGTGGFSGSTNVSVLGGPGSIALGDLNNDGKLDFVTTDAYSYAASVRFGNGNGTFNGNMYLTTGFSPNSVALGDVNNDGNLDIAIANSGENTVFVWLGDGSGNFSTPNSITVGSGPQHVTLADINGDSYLDVVTTNSYDLSLSIRLGDGTGNFSENTTIALDNNSVMTAIGDVNNDGILDLATSSTDISSVEMRLGTPPPPVVRSVSPSANAVHVHPSTDVSLTLSTTMNVQSLNSTNIRITGSQTGLYGTSAITYHGTSNTVQLSASADFKPGEIISVSVTTGIRSSDNVSITRATVWSFMAASGEASGLFASSTEIPVESAPLHTALGDINHDGYLDLAVVNSISNTVSILLGDGTGNFSGSTTIPALSPISVFFGDVNNDGNLDLAITSIVNKVSILLGNGTGTFSSTTDISVDTFPSWIALGDINGDGHLDLATANMNAGTVSIRLGSNTGIFSGNIEIPIGSSPTSVVLGDVNGDGMLDLATANPNGNAVSVHFGNGTGNFPSSTTIPVGNYPYYADLGDVNGDGKLDIVAANFNSNTVSIRLGDGTGNFSGTTNIPVGNGPRKLSLGDLNGDGILDFATVNSASNTASIRLGDGTGNFSGTTTLPVGTEPTGITFGDVNNDGILDIATVNRSSNNISILLGSPIPTLLSFSPSANELNVAPDTDIQLTFNTAMNVSDIATHIRITGSQTGLHHTSVTAYNATTNTLTLTSPTGFSPGELITVSVTTAVQSSVGVNTTRATTWSFTVAAGVASGIYADNTVVFTADTPTGILLGDVNNDGILDIVTANEGSDAVSVRLGDGSGNFSVGIDVPVGDAPKHISLGDVNNDGYLDIVTANWQSSTASIRLGDGTGNFSGTIEVTAGGFASHIVLGDINGDGQIDLAAVHPGKHSISVHFGDGAGNVTGMTNLPASSANGICSGDINGDGYPDFVTANTSGNSVSIHFGNGAGSFSNGIDVPVGTAPTSVTLGDINGDGYLDIATANTSDNSVSVRLGDGAGNFIGITDVPVGDAPVAIVLGDANGDGNLDIVVANRDGSTVSIRSGDGAGNFSGSTDISTGSNPQGLALGDINGDGTLDLAIANTGDNTVSIRLGMPIPRLLSFSPSINELNVASASLTNLIFNTGMNSSSLASPHIKIYGSLTGAINTSALLYNTTTNTLTLTPALNFKPGEIISMSVTTGVRSLSDVHLTSATVWNFTASVQGGTGGFGALLLTTSTATYTTNIAVGDLDGDGDLDIFEGNMGQANTVRLNDGTGIFTTGWTGNVISPAYTTCVSLGDIDSDGDLDIFEGTSGAGNTIWINDGTGNFTSGWQSTPSGSVTINASFADFDGDGDLDILENNAGGDSKVLLNDGTGNFTPGWIRSATATAEIRAVTGDFDSDGDLDIFETNVGEPNKLWQNDGRGNFMEKWIQNSDLLLPVQALIAGDLDGDGDLDIVEGGLSRSARVWYNDGTGAFTVGLVLDSLISTSSLVLGDFDNDGATDVFAGSSSHTNTLYRNNGNGSFTVTWTQASTTSTLAVAAGDMDNDGDLDIVEGNYTAANHLWMNDHPPHLVLISANPLSIESSDPTTLVVAIQREEGLPYYLPADTTIGIVIQHPLLRNTYVTEATFHAGQNSTTLSINLINSSTTAVTTTLTLSVLHSSIVSTSAVVTISPNQVPQITAAETFINIYENSSTTLSVHIADAETAATQLTVRATSNNITLLPVTSILQDGSTDATTSFIVQVATNATGTVVITVTVSDGLHEISTTITLGVRPIAPATNILATALNNGAKLQWTPSTTPTVTAYALYHGMSSGALTLLATVSSTTTSYTHTGLDDGLRHYYAIRSIVSDAGYSPLSNEVSIIPNTLQVLYPNGGEVLQVGTEHLLRWQYSGDISSMRIEYSTDTGSNWTSITQLVTLAGNKPLTTFYQEWTVVDAPTTTALIRVVSLSPSTMEDRSNTTFSISTVSAPSNLLATAGSTTISLSWTASGSENITGYMILRGTSLNTLTELTTVGVTTSSVDTYASNCTNYYYAVRTIANARLSPNSNNTSAQIVVPDNLDIISPNGGEIWQAGTPHSITWTSTGCAQPATVTIDYSTNNGANWTTVTTTANTGSYMWIVPNMPTSQALIRIDNGSLQDNSNTSFTISPIPAPINLTAIAGNTSAELHWTHSSAQGLTGYEVYRGTTSGSLSLMTTLVSTATMYTDVDATNCMVFVYAVKAVVGTMSSEFSNDVAVTPHGIPAITILSPAGGEIWQAGAQRTITWTSTGCTIPENVLIEYSIDNGNSWATISTTSNDGSYVWLIPNQPTTQAIVRVSGDALFATGEEVFTIAPVPAPENLTVTTASNQAILNWMAPAAQGISSYEVYRGTTSGSLSLLATVTSTATTYTDTDVTNCTLYLYAVTTRVGSLSSDFSNEVQATPQITPAITVLSPNGSDIWHGGQTKLITWSSTGCSLSATVSLHYSINNGAEWNVIATAVNSGSYNWLVPDTSSTQVLVRVSNDMSSDVNNIVFTILPLPVPIIEAVQPTVSTSYCPGSPTPVSIGVNLAGPIYPATALHVYVTSSDQSLIADGSIVQQGATAATTTFSFTPTTTASSTAVLTVTVSNGYTTASTTITASVTVRSLPSTTISGNTSACASTDGYTYRVQPFPGNTYKWTVTGGSIVSGNGAHEISVQWNAPGTGVVGVTVTGGNSCLAETSLDVTIHDIPTPTLAVDGPTTVCAGGSVLLTAQPAKHTYLWSNGATTQSITATTSGLYTVTVSNAEGCSVVSTGVAITVLPEVIAVAGQDVAICSNSTVQLNGGGSSVVGNLTFSWIPAASLSNPHIANPIASLTVTTTYTLTITDGNGCSSTASVTVTVRPAPETMVSSDIAICAGGSTQLQASGGTDYVWTPSTGLNDARLSSPIASPTETTTYSVTITAAGECPVQRQVTVTVPTLAVVSAGSDVSICAGSSTQLLATGGESYAWMPVTGLDNPTRPNPLATPKETTTYTVVVTSAAGCTATTSVTVTVLPVQLHVSVLLEGPYNGSSMATSLHTQGLLPQQQPYNAEPFYYAGTETLAVTGSTAVVDWVLVELRSGIGPETFIERRAGLLMESGAVLASDGKPLMYTSLVAGSTYYIVVWHRNHLSIMSSAAPYVSNECELSYNFTSSRFVAYNSFADGQKEIRTGVFGMMMGDAMPDGLINAIDRAAIRNMSGATGYLRQDISLDGIVNAVDRVMVRNNAFLASQVP